MSRENKTWWNMDKTEWENLEKRAKCIFMVVMNNIYTISIDLTCGGILLFILANLFGVNGNVKNFLSNVQWLGKLLVIGSILLAILDLICVIVSSFVLKLRQYIVESVFVVSGAMVFWRFPFTALWKIVTWSDEDRYYLTWIFALVLVYIFWWSVKRFRFLSEAEAKSEPDSLTLILYKNDKIYVPQLLAKIENEDTRKRAANEIYSYVYGASKNKALYLGLMFLSIAFPAAAVALNNQEFFNGKATIVVTVVSLLAAIVSGLLGLLKAKEAWVRYREFSERTKAEIVSYVLGIGVYENKEKGKEMEKIANADNILATRLENLYAEEGGRWRDLHDAKDDLLEAGVRGIKEANDPEVDDGK